MADQAATEAQQHFAALDGGSVTLALATAVDHPIHGQVVVGIKTDDVDGAAKAIEASGGGIVKGPYDLSSAELGQQVGGWDRMTLALATAVDHPSTARSWSES